MSKISREDAASLRYFIEKGDVSRWTSWAEKRESLIEAMPELDDMILAQRVADSLRDEVDRRLSEIEYGDDDDS